MEQGTGKTRTVLELIKYRLDKNKIDKVLWLCPCSTKQNLKNEIIKHTGAEQKELIEICGIETLSRSEKTIERMNQFVDDNKVFIVIDESLLVKNFFAKRTIQVVNLAAKCPYRIILNGTPVSRNEADLFAQWYILDWRILGYKSFYSFAANHIEYDDKYHKFRRCLNVDYLTDKIAPYTYQIKKSECIKLPDKHYKMVGFEMTEEQSQEYYLTYCGFMANISEFDSTTVYRFFSAMSAVLAGRKVSVVKKHIVTTPMFKSPYDNPRIKRLLDVIPKEDKTIVFCKYTHEIDDIITVLEKEYGEGCCVRFDGSVNLKKRNENLAKFRDDKKVLYFIANKNCAGYGLNLQFCHNIIFYDNDWNLGTRLQAEDRVHRIGQAEDVNIIDIFAYDSVDERILDCLSKKEGLVDSISWLIKEKNETKLKDALREICGIKEE